MYKSDQLRWKIRFSHVNENSFPKKEGREILHSKGSSLHWTVFAADILGDFGHSLVVGQAICVLQLVQVVNDPGVSLLAPNLGHHLLMVGRLNSLIQGLGAPGKDARAGVDVNGGIGKTVQQELLIDDVLAMLNENSLHSSSKGVNTLASEGSGLGQVGVDMGGQVVA